MNFLIAERNYLPQESIINLDNNPTDRNNPGRIQVDENSFILPPKDIYHSCDPNAYIDWNTMKLKALKAIKKGSAITYHYGTSEYDYAVGEFDCICGNLNCLKQFRGYKYLSFRQREQIKSYLSPYLKSQDKLR